MYIYVVYGMYNTLNPPNEKHCLQKNKYTILQDSMK